MKIFKVYETIRRIQHTAIENDDSEDGERKASGFLGVYITNLMIDSWLKKGNKYVEQTCL